MTREEAIKKLKEQQNKFNEHCIDYVGINEVYNIAIHSIENEQKLKEAVEKIKTDIENSARYTLGRDYLLSYDAVMNIILEYTEELV